MKIYNFYKNLSTFLMKTFYRIKVEGKENLPNEQGYLICANHIHMFDPILITVCSNHQVSHMAKKELFKIPILGYIFKKCGSFPIDRGNIDLNSIRTAVNILKEKKVLSIFPEGTRHKDGKFRDIKNGAAYVAIQAKSNIIPMRIIGNYKKPFSKLTLRIGKPISSTGCTMEELTEKLRIAIENLAPIPAV